jgi:tryptophanyl-tRNA synthetase
MAKNNNTRLDPWSVKEVKNYSLIMKEFGIDDIDTVVARIPSPNKYIRRKINFGHIELGTVLDAVEKNEPYAVMSGIKPTGSFHLGSKITAEELIFFQQLSSKAVVFYCIADYEAYADNRMSFADSLEIAVENVADLLALGLNPKKAFIYRQSADKRLLDMAFTFTRDVTYNMMEAIYGDKAFGLYISALIQVADILLPQMKDFGGPKPTVVPVGVDQAPHIRLTRDITRKYQKEYGFLLPSAVFHKLIRSLKGTFKMSKREPMGILTLNDDPETAKKKILEAFTGGRDTVSLQRRLGGEPEKCTIYELLMYHFVDDDNAVKARYEKCIAGENLCGDCKAYVADFVANYLREHQKRRQSHIDTARKILKTNTVLYNK